MWQLLLHTQSNVCSRVLLGGSAILYLYMFSLYFCKNCLLRISRTICSVIVAYETRLTENGTPLEPNLLKRIFPILEEILHSPQYVFNYVPVYH